MIAATDETRTEIIGRLNDRCRHGLDRTARIVVTQTCLAALSDTTIASQAIAQAHLLQALRRCTFAVGDCERNRGSFLIRDIRVFFSIDYYDLDLEYGSENPADASVTRRVLTLMLREDL